MNKVRQKVGLVLVGILLLASVALMLILREIQPATPKQTEGYVAGDCWFPLLSEWKAYEWQVECGHLYTEQARGGFVLPVVVIRDTSPDRRPDPLVYLTGGPGNSSFLEARNIDHWFYWLEIADLSRDLILVDQRGTGLSEPGFRCQGYESGQRAILDKNLSLEEEHQAQFAVMEDCLALMTAGGLSLEHFSTTHSALDMMAVMDALGYEQWNVLGGSYGSRLALEWLRLEEENIRALVLDSVYPVDKGSLADWPEQLQASFSTFWVQCRTAGVCGEEDGEGNVAESSFWQAMEQLREEPRTMTVALWHGGWPVRIVLNEHRFLSAVYSALYDDTLHEHITLAIREVLTGGEKSLMKLVASTVNSQLAPEFNPMVYLAVDCAESSVVSREDYEQVRAAYPAWAAYTEHAWDYDICHLIPRRADLAEFKQPVSSSSIPALILSGGLDPVTPAVWAHELVASMSGAQHWHVADTGHGVSASRACIHQALRHFLDAPQQAHPFPCN